MEKTCRICGNTEKNRLHKAREMMFGTREEFDYLECGGCGTLQSCEIPDSSLYYPKDYYSFAEDQESYFSDKLQRRIAARFVGDYFVSGRNFIGKRLAQKDVGFVFFFPESLKEQLLNLNFNSRILDFGCGNGKLLKRLHYFGFRNLTGADAFIENEIFYKNGIKIFKKNLPEIEPFFDFVMLHHSFEHLPAPLESLREIHRLLPENKFCLIRIPLKNFAWEKYGVNWFQLDAPRHLFLYTEKSFRGLAEKAGFIVEKVVYDSEVYQFYISEQYAQNIAMNDERAFNGDFEQSIFTPEQMQDWKRQTEKLNAENRGDQACFYLRKL